MGDNSEILYRSTAQTDCQPRSLGRPKHPLPHKAPDYLLAEEIDVEFECLLDAVFPPAPKNTPASAAIFNSLAGYNLVKPNAILTDYSQPSDSGGGLGRFTGTFTIVPASWDQFLTQNVTFPGIRDLANTGGVRDPKPLNVSTRLRRDYFVLDPDGILAALATPVKDSGGAAVTLVASEGAIPSLYRTPWRYLLAGVIQSGSEVTGLVKAGGVGGYLETVPNTALYEAWQAVATAFNAQIVTPPPGGAQPWDADHPPVWDGVSEADATVGQYRFTDSRLEDYAGNIICRVAEYVLVQ